MTGRLYSFLLHIHQSKHSHSETNWKHYIQKQHVNRLSASLILSRKVHYLIFIDVGMVNRQTRVERMRINRRLVLKWNSLFTKNCMGPAPTSRAFYESALFNLKWTSTKISPFSTWVNCLNSYHKDWMVVSSSGGDTLNPDTHGTLIWSECVMSQSRSLRRYLRYLALSNECNILILCHLQHSSTLVVLNRGIC